MGLGVVLKLGKERGLLCFVLMVFTASSSGRHEGRMTRLQKERGKKNEAKQVLRKPAERAGRGPRKSPWCSTCRQLWPFALLAAPVPAAFIAPAEDWPGPNGSPYLTSNFKRLGQGTSQRIQKPNREHPPIWREERENMGPYGP